MVRRDSNIEQNNKRFMTSIETKKKQVCRSSLFLSRNIYSGRITCCPLVSGGEYADGTDGLTPDRYIMLSARRDQRVKRVRYEKTEQF